MHVKLVLILSLSFPLPSPTPGSGNQHSIFYIHEVNISGFPTAMTMDSTYPSIVIHVPVNTVWYIQRSIVYTEPSQCMQLSLFIDKKHSEKLQENESTQFRLSIPPLFMLQIILQGVRFWQMPWPIGGASRIQYACRRNLSVLLQTPCWPWISSWTVVEVQPPHAHLLRQLLAPCDPHYSWF